jgi:hypothetical protein
MARQQLSTVQKSGSRDSEHGPVVRLKLRHGLLSHALGFFHFPPWRLPRLPLRSRLS